MDIFWIAVLIFVLIICAQALMFDGPKYSYKKEPNKQQFCDLDDILHYNPDVVNAKRLTNIFFELVRDLAAQRAFLYHNYTKLHNDYGDALKSPANVDTISWVEYELAVYNDVLKSAIDADYSLEARNIFAKEMAPRVAYLQRIREMLISHAKSYQTSESSSSYNKRTKTHTKKASVYDLTLFAISSLPKTHAEFKRAYHNAAKKHHPDAPTGNKTHFQNLAALYENISRQHYGVTV